MAGNEGSERGNLFIGILDDLALPTDDHTLVKLCHPAALRVLTIIVEIEIGKRNINLETDPRVTLQIVQFFPVARTVNVY